jgi:hypothetical protein
MMRNYNKYKHSLEQELERRIKRLEIKRTMNQHQLKTDQIVILNN